MAFETKILNEVTGPIVDKAQREAELAKDRLMSVIDAEVHSATAKRLIWKAAAGYALARQEIMEAKVGQDARNYVDADQQNFNQLLTVLAAPYSPEGEAIRANDRATFAEIQATLEEA